MKKIIILLAVVVAAKTTWAEINVGETVGNQCLKNKTEQMICHGVSEFDEQSYEIQMTVKSDCFHYRFVDYGHWTIDVKSKDIQVFSMTKNFEDQNLNRSDSKKMEFVNQTVLFNKPFKATIQFFEDEKLILTYETITESEFLMMPPKHCDNSNLGRNSCKYGKMKSYQYDLKLIHLKDVQCVKSTEL